MIHAMLCHALSTPSEYRLAIHRVFTVPLCFLILHFIMRCSISVNIASIDSTDESKATSLIFIYAAKNSEQSHWLIATCDVPQENC